MIIKFRISALIATIVLIFMAWQAANASLVIYIYQNHKMYIAGDSLTHGSGSELDFYTPKVFKLSDTCCVAISGDFGYAFKDEKSGHVIEKIIYPFELGKICGDLQTSDASVWDKIQTVVLQFGAKYNGCISKAIQAELDLTSLKGTQLLFVGYNPVKKNFFYKTCLFKGTDPVTVEPKYENELKHNLTSISFQGEDHFLTTLMRSAEPKYIKLKSANFKSTWKKLNTEGAKVSDQTITNFMIEMFNLHKTNAAALGLDKGWVDEPYIIYKITKEKALQIH